MTCVDETCIRMANSQGRLKDFSKAYSVLLLTSSISDASPEPSGYDILIPDAGCIGLQTSTNLFFLRMLERSHVAAITVDLCKHIC